MALCLMSEKISEHCAQHIQSIQKNIHACDTECLDHRSMGDQEDTTVVVNHQEHNFHKEKSGLFLFNLISSSRVLFSYTPWAKGTF